jgi:hypothetical protein
MANDTEITIEQIQAFIDANRERADVAEYISTLAVEKPLNAENVSAYLGTVEGKNLLQPIIDRANTQAIKSHDDKQKPIIAAQIKAGINEELIKLNPTETPEQRMIRELKQNQDAMQAQMNKERLDYAIAQEFAKRNVPLELAKDIPYPSVEHAINAAIIWEQVKSKEIDKVVNERLASMQKKPELGQQKETTSFSEWYKTATPEERKARFMQEAEQRDSISRAAATAPAMVLK